MTNYIFIRPVNFSNEFQTIAQQPATKKSNQTYITALNYGRNKELVQNRWAIIYGIWYMVIVSQHKITIQ